MFKLYTYWRSSAAYRVRIALHLKGLPYESIPINLLRDGGQQFTSEYTAVNPQQLVPALVDESGDEKSVLSQSLAIMEYLDEAYPNTAPLLPAQPLQRAKVRAFAQAIACDIHPLNNSRVLKYIMGHFERTEEQRDVWVTNWITLGLTALEKQMVARAMPTLFCFGDEPGLAECCLIPQLFNARRFKVPLDAFPTLIAVDARCNALSAFVDAAPERQPDATQ